MVCRSDYLFGRKKYSNREYYEFFVSEHKDAYQFEHFV